MNNKLTKNYFYNLIYQVLMIIGPVITVPFLSRSLGASGVGEYSYCYSLTGYFVLVATLGCDVYGRREISYVKEDILERSKRFWSIQTIKIISTILVFGIYLLFSLNNKNSIMLLILGIHLLNVPLNIGWFFQGAEQFKKITTRGLFLKIVDLLFVLFFIHKPDDLLLYTFGSSLIAFITFFVLWIDLKKYLTKVDIRDLNIKIDLQNCFVFFLPSIATSIYTMLDKTMLGVMTEGFSENGYYEQSLKINVIFLRVVLSLGTVLMPAIAYAFKQNNMKVVFTNIKKSIKYVYFVALPIAFGLCAISDIFVPWFFGAGFEKVSVLLKISGFILIFQGIDDVLGVQYLVTTGKQKLYIISLFMGALFNFVCNLYLIPRFQSIGAMSASLLSECIIVGMQMYFVRNEFQFIKLLKPAKNYLIASVIMFIIINYLIKFVNASIIDNILVGGVGGTIYIVILLLLKDSFVMSILNPLKNKLLKK
jgi:O-antigen/teichoic acid export membrane protein